MSSAASSESVDREQRIAAVLFRAEVERREIPRFTKEWPTFDLATAYRVQRSGIERREASGRNRVGIKLGLTSLAKQQQMGVSSPLTGVLTSDMELTPGEALVVADLIHPKVEPELVFVFEQDVAGPLVDAGTVRNAVRSVHAGVEIIDSRYLDFDFQLSDVIADNASSAKYLVSATGLAPDQIDVISEQVSLHLDGTLVAEATGAAVMGDPFEAVALAIRDLATRGDGVRAGETVLSGALTDAQRLSSGSTAVATFGTLGTLTLHAI